MIVDVESKVDQMCTTVFYKVRHDIAGLNNTARARAVISLLTNVSGQMPAAWIIQDEIIGNS